MLWSNLYVFCAVLFCCFLVVVSTSAVTINCLERLVSSIAFYLWNKLHDRSLMLCCLILFFSVMHIK